MIATSTSNLAAARDLLEKLRLEFKQDHTHRTVLIWGKLEDLAQKLTAIESPLSDNGKRLLAEARIPCSELMARVSALPDRNDVKNLVASLSTLLGQISADMQIQEFPVTTTGGNVGADSHAILPAAGVVIKSHAEPSTILPKGSDDLMLVGKAGITDDMTLTRESAIYTLPTPIAIPLQTFFLKTNPIERFREMRTVLSWLMRYLISLGLSDLFQCVASNKGSLESLMRENEFEVIRECRGYRRKSLTLGEWRIALGKAADWLSDCSDSFVKELAENCGSKSDFQTEFLEPIVRMRNLDAHQDSEDSLNSSEIEKLVEEGEERLIKGLNHLRFLWRYPLGFAEQEQSRAARADSEVEKEAFFRIHSLMGVYPRETSVKCTLSTSPFPARKPLQPCIPFIVDLTNQSLLHLFPFVYLPEVARQKHGRLALHIFVSTKSDMWPYLTHVVGSGLGPERKGEFEAVEVDGSGWFEASSENRASFDWLVFEYRDRYCVRNRINEEITKALRPFDYGALVGQSLKNGKYSLRGVIHEGPLYTIYRAWDNSNKREAAVKVLEVQQPTNVLISQVEIEFERIKRFCQHPGIIDVYDFDREAIGGKAYSWYSMQFALGDLSRQISVRNFPLAAGTHPWNDMRMRSEIIEEALAVLEAVSYLHSQNHVHRDIKPTNILIMHPENRPRIRLADFGLMRNLEPSAETRQRTPRCVPGEGTPTYMSPEQANGQDATPEDDVYSLGILLAELTMGEHPAVTNKSRYNKNECTISAWLRKKQKEISPDCLELFEILEKSTQAQRRNRFKSASEMYEAFAQCCRKAGLLV